MNSKLPTPLLLGKSRAFELLKIGSFKFPPTRAKRVFKCPTHSSNLSVRGRCRLLSSFLKLVYKHANTQQHKIETIKNYLKLNKLPSWTLSISKCKLLLLRNTVSLKMGKNTKMLNFKRNCPKHYLWLTNVCLIQEELKTSYSRLHKLVFIFKLFTLLLNVLFVGAVRVFHNPRLISKSGLFFSNKQPYCHVLVRLASKIWKQNVCTQKSPYTVKEKLFCHFCFD